MTHRDLWGVAKPRGHHLDGELLHEFCFAARAKVVEQPRPRLEAGAPYDLLEGCTQVGIRPAGWPLGRLAVLRVNDILSTIRG